MALRHSSRSLRVLFIMPPCLPTPPQGYGGIEAVAAALLPELERQDVSITLATTVGSTVEVTDMRELSEQLYPILSHAYNVVSPRMEAYVTRVMELIWDGDFDVVHDFSGLLTILNTLAAPLRSGFMPPVIHTIHGPIAPAAEVYQRLIQHSNLIYTAISEAQLSTAPPQMWPRTRVIYNGLKTSEYPVGPGGDRLLVMGRICSDKGQDRLLSYCAQVGIPLDIAGTVAEISRIEDIEAEVAKGGASASVANPDFQLYCQMRPLIDGRDIVFHGNVGGELKHQLLGTASAMVIPNRWAEPFGMVAIEAMASGTPVVAMATGAMPELIEHGVSGYLANSFEELCEYLQPEVLAKLDRDATRRRVEEKFGIAPIASQYIELYREMSRRTNLSPSPLRSDTTKRELTALYEQLPTPKSRRGRQQS